MVYGYIMGEWIETILMERKEENNSGVSKVVHRVREVGEKCMLS